ncbi:hypothetical protein GCM10010954_15340 [Halobacillus andaensis]|uniref:Uncharacterized protein n=1 Tax=Halobacillus andaensis TaxID=1176239 RepID=A0A917EUE0_HALAA|nr:hypothetical protein [Halobacillus andaensis]MBP2004966.1 hypothetical protein [Halobacillus andaensis]GGF17528.1 hypothetical protein GCM10010954_15340 [Halobacillus andaensis]
MRKIALCFMCIWFIGGGTVSAISWEYPFVVWDGGVYQVTEEPVEEVGEPIGEVESKPDDQGDYRGNASNAYDIGTTYYSIPAADPNEEIAVAVENDEYVKAVYENEAPKGASFYIAALFIGITVITLLIVLYLRRLKKK